RTAAGAAAQVCGGLLLIKIFVDKETITNAYIRKVKSRLGEAKAPRRTVDEYLGSLQRIPLKGLSQPAEYYEIFWDQQLYGVKSSAVTTEAGYKHFEDRIPPRSGPSNWQLGRVTRMSDRFGFIRSGFGQDMEDFFFCPDFLFRKDLEVLQGSEVWFMPAPPSEGSKQRQAVNVIALNVLLEGKLVHVNPKGFGYVECVTSGGDSVRLFLNLGGAQGWTVEDRVSFTLGKNAKGPAGEQPAKI
ncbi:hypothetical protein NZK33_21220, partial [Cyanobium sp. FGCU-6]|nr:hypothetical protein [Cyanobium sp. FGCU6]